MGIRALGRDVAPRVVLRHGEPGGSRGEASVAARVPLHRGALWIAIQPVARDVAFERVQAVFGRDRHPTQSQLVAGIEDGRTGEGK